MNTHFIKRACNAAPYLRLCALGLWLAWSQLAFGAGVWVDASELNSSASANVNLASTIGFFLACICLSAFHKQAFKMFSRRGFFVGIGCVCTLACVLIWLSGPQFIMKVSMALAIGISLTSAFLTGVCTALIAARCMQLLSTLKPRKAWLLAVTNILLSACTYFLVTACPHLLCISLFCLLPLFACLLIYYDEDADYDENTSYDKGAAPEEQENLKALKKPEGAAELKPARDPKKATVSEAAQGNSAESRAAQRRNAESKLVSLGFGLFGRFCIMACVMTFALAIVRYESVYSLGPAIAASYSNVAMAARVFFAIFLLFAILNLSRNINFSKFYYFVLLLVVFIPLVTSVFSIGSILMNTLIVALYSVFEMLVFCVLAHISSQFDSLSLKVFGCGWGALTLGGLLGFTVGTYVPLIFPAENILIILSVIVIVLCIPVAMFLFTGKDFDELIALYVGETEYEYVEAKNSLASAQGGDIAGLASGAQSSNAVQFAYDTQAAESAFLAFCGEYKLSSRETEIARAIIKGTRPDDIAESLYLSINTVRRHIQNIYLKTGVHSREDLSSLFNQKTGVFDHSML